MRLKFLFFAFLLSVSVFGQSVPLSQNTTVSVLTCGTGPEVYALFGHTAIRIHDVEQHFDVVYNYGAFDFNTPNFGLKFAKGDLQYFATSGTFDDFIIQYNFEKRSVYEQELNIPHAQKQALFDHLNAVMYSGERYYTYKFIDRNCTNMAVDAINKALVGKIIYKQKNTDETYRETLYPYFDGHFYEKLGTQILFGTKTDQDATLLFLPFELKESLDMTKYNGVALAQKTKILAEFEPQPVPGSWWNNIFTLLAALMLVVIANKRTITLVYLALIAMVGLLMCFTTFYSQHAELKMNYNLLLFNPALLVLAIFYMRSHTKGIFAVTWFCIASMGIYLVIMLNKVHLLIVLPIIATNSILLAKILKNRHPKMTN